MGEKIVVGPIDKGIRNDVTPFNIDNTNFLELVNAYQWRGRIKRKRGTSLLGRLTRFFNNSLPYTNIATFVLADDGLGNGIANLFSELSLSGSLVPGKVIISDQTAVNLYTDNGLGILIGAPAGTGTVNYSTSAIFITGAAGHTVSVTITYYPTLPVMGLRDFITPISQFPFTIGFDTTYSYNVVTSFPYPIYDVSWYKNVSTGTYPGYVRKTNSTPTTWNGQDYQQFWTTNYQGAMWATNGINVPFNITNIGMQYKPITAMTIDSAGPPALVTLTIVAHGLVQGDFVFINEVQYTAPNLANSINFQTGYVVSADPQAANTVQVEFPNANLTGTYSGGGIAQYLTNRSDVTKDCLRFYDGDPTNGNVTTPVINGTRGWVNFAPPLSREQFSISDAPEQQYYLVGARMIIDFKDRLLFLGAVIQSSAAGSQIYLQDTIVYSQNGTPYYTASFNGDPTLATTVFFPILTPINQTATPNSYWEDQTGFGGSESAAVDAPLTTMSKNKDVLLCGFDTSVQAKFVYTSNDLKPFSFYLINSELGDTSTFSCINLDRGKLTVGNRGFLFTNQESCDRFDAEIPDNIFQIRLSNNGPERVTAHRDYVNKWVYFTYTSNQRTYIFPNQTLQYNYEDKSWAIFNEHYTTYGNFRKRTGFTWQTVGLVYPTWSSWTVPWNAGSSNLLQPEVIAGNAQGFIVVRDDGVNEANSLSISSFSGNTVTSNNHTLNEGDYIVISGAIGTISEQVNDFIFSVGNPTANTFELDPAIDASLGTYFGGAVIKRLYVPFIQTKQFNPSWAMSRKTRIGVQQYLLSTTARAQITLQIYLSQNSSSAYNLGPLVPSPLSVNNSLVYSTVLFTCPESTNLGLTPANTNLMTPTATNQAQIWHRINTSLIGDTVQLGFTMSDDQMREMDENGPIFSITGATATEPCILTATTNFVINQLVNITGVLGMVELNNHTYVVTNVTPTTVTIDVNASGFGTYISGGSITREVFINQFSEIELHGFTLEVYPSQLLS